MDRIDKEIDFSSVWSWTLPLWGLAVLVTFLGAAITEEPVLPAYVKQAGGRSRR